MKHDQLGACVAALAGALWCSLYIGPLLDPFTLDVVFRDDWAQHTLGWLFFRNEHLAFPVGRLRNFLHPLGTTLGYMDSIPWVALSLRPISPLLPPDFQYLGVWILLCSASLAFVAARIARHITPHWEQQALVGTLTAMSPTLIARIIHPALCGHTFIVAAMGLHLRGPESIAAVRRTLITAFVLIAIASATHPYFALMVTAIAVGLPLRERKRIGTGVMFAVLGGMLALSAGILALLGYLGGGMQDAVDGFGVYSANLNTFINSMGHSRIFRGLPTSKSQYEGYCYLGAGTFFMAALTAGCLAFPSTRQRILGLPWRRAGWPLFAACAFAVFAFASPIRWGQHELFNIELYKPFDSFTQSFRSSGRFIWVLGYFIVLSATLSMVRALRDWRLWSSLALLTAVVVQAYDLDLGEAHHHFDGARERPFEASEWSLADRVFKHLVLYPAEIMNACDGPKGYRGRFVTELAYLAYRHHWTFNSGYAARVRPSTGQYCEELKQTVRAGQLKPDTVYVIGPRDLKRMRAAGAVCGRLNRVLVCVQASDQALAAYLTDHPK